MRKKKVDYAEELYDKIWKTKGARFNAYERLRKTKNLSFQSTSLLSAYLIIVNLVTPFSLLPSSIDPSFVSFISLALSIVLLVFVTIENSVDYSLKGEEFHTCSKELSRLFNKLDQILDSDNPDKNEIDKISDQYGQILDKYDNHSPIDYNLHKTKHPNDFNLNFIERNWIKLKVYYVIHAKYLISIFGPPLLLFLWLIFWQ